MGGHPDARYEVADPLTQVPIRANVRCVYAQADDRVPSHKASRMSKPPERAGQPAQLLEVHGDHFSLTETASLAWPVVITALRS
jgi:hypothetical protein